MLFFLQLAKAFDMGFLCRAMVGFGMVVNSGCDVALLHARYFYVGQWRVNRVADTVLYGGFFEFGVPFHEGIKPPKSLLP